MAIYAKSIGFAEQASALANPTEGNRKVYIKADGKMYQKDSAGTETEIGGGGSSSGGASRWTVFTPAFARTADSTFTTTDADATALLVGLPVRYKDIAGTYNYGIITGKSSAAGTTTFTLKGAPIDTSHDAVLEYGFPEMVIQHTYVIGGYFSTASSTTLLQTKNFYLMKWILGKAYCVGFQVKVLSDDTGAAQPNVNVTCGGNSISTSNSNAGIGVSDAVWIVTVVDVNTANYVCDYDEVIEITTDAAGTNDDARDLTVHVWFVLE